MSDTDIHGSFAAAAGLQEVRLIHGVGTGRIRDAAREELGCHPLVERFTV